MLTTPARPPCRRLATAHLGVKGVVTVASHPVEPLWNIDKVSYLSLVVGTSDRLRTQLAACVEFALANEPCLICCSSGSSLSVLCAAACVAARCTAAVHDGRRQKHLRPSDKLLCRLRLCSGWTRPVSHPIAANGVERDLVRQPPFPSVALCAVCDSSSIRGSLPQRVWGVERTDARRNEEKVDLSLRDTLGQGDSAARS